jgi:hypothetical protein
MPSSTMNPEGDLGPKAFSGPSVAGNAEDLAKQVAASASQRSNSGAKYVCATQTQTVHKKPNPNHRILVGNPIEISRWVPGSVVNFTVDTVWPLPLQYHLVRESLIAAAKEWNIHEVGVSFNYVGNIANATFTVIYGGNHVGGAYAEAFSPGPEDLSRIRLFDRFFTLNGRWEMRAIFLHELGHVLGLRHEFAGTVAFDPYPAVPLGPQNSLSVMAYNHLPVIQTSDIYSIKYFYQLPPIGLIRDYSAVRIRSPWWFPFNMQFPFNVRFPV